MAKSKITYEWSDDGTGRTCLKVRRKTGKLTWSEVMEVLHDDYRFEGRYFLLELHSTGYLPEDLYDEGDIWVLYEPEDYFKKDWPQRLRPLKPNMQSIANGHRIATCPTCCADVKKTGVNDGYCSACGQELDWNER